MAFLYLDENNLFQTFDDSKSYMKVFQDPLDELDRIARNKPHAGIPKEYPKVTDGTTSSIVQKTPRRIIQQLPTGMVTSDTDDWLSLVASFIYLNKIIPNANMQYALLQKCWLVVENGLANGSCTVYTPFIVTGSYTGTSMRVVAAKDVFFQSGKVSAHDSDVSFMRAYYQEKDIDAIIDTEEKLAKSARERGEKYESEWDIAELKAVRKKATAKADDALSTAEKDKTGEKNNVAIEIIHAFQRGVGATFYSFHAETKKILRTCENKDPRGEIPLTTFYAGVDGFNPLGRGLVEILAPLQNLMDSEMQMYQFERALMLAPPTIKRGSWNKSQAKLVPNAIVDLGTNSDNSWEVLKRDSTALNQFPDNYGLMKSQLLNMASSPDTSISSDIGNPGFSKTDSGVKQVAANVSVDDNYIRKQFETFFEEWSETAINLYFAERTDIEEMQLDRETAAKIHKINPELVSDDDVIRIDFSTATAALKFEVDASTSNMKDNAQQLDALDALLTRVEKSPLLQQIIQPDKLVSVWNSIVSASGVEDPEKLSIDEEEFKQMQEAQKQAAEQEAAAQQAASTQQSAQQMALPMPQADPMQEQMEQPQEQVAEAPNAEFTEEDMAFIQQLRDMGMSDDRIGQALAMEQANVPEEQILAMLTEATNG